MRVLDGRYMARHTSSVLSQFSWMLRAVGDSLGLMRAEKYRGLSGIPRQYWLWPPGVQSLKFLLVSFRVKMLIEADFCKVLLCSWPIKPFTAQGF